LKFLTYAYRELWPAGKNDPPVLKGSIKPGPNRVNIIRHFLKRLLADREYFLRNDFSIFRDFAIF